MVDDPLTPFLREGVRLSGYDAGMDHLFIAGRAALSDAVDLIERFGGEAGLQAAVRASESREAGNILRFCHWRQIERVVEALGNDEVQGTVH